MIHQIGGQGGGRWKPHVKTISHKVGSKTNRAQHNSRQSNGISRQGPRDKDAGCNRVARSMETIYEDSGTHDCVYASHEIGKRVGYASGVAKTSDQDY